MRSICGKNYPWAGCCHLPREESAIPAIAAVADAEAVTSVIILWEAGMSLMWFVNHILVTGAPEDKRKNDPFGEYMCMRSF